MIAQASGLAMGVGRFSRLLGGMVVLEMPDARLNTTQWVDSACEVPPGGGVLRLLVSGIAVGIFIDLHCVVGGVEVTH